MHIVACQFDIAWKDRQENFARVRSLLAAQATPPGSLIVLPEMFASGFTMNVGVDGRYCVRARGDAATP